jgi:hypothetical protein
MYSLVRCSTYLKKKVGLLCFFRLQIVERQNVKLQIVDITKDVIALTYVGIWLASAEST